MSILVVGSVAFDTLKTAYGERQKILGGAATYFSLSASYFTDVRVIAVVGEDFTAEDAPRVGDGLVLVEPNGQVKYASPNAMSALHRMGVSDVVEGRRLSELGIDDAALDWALRAGCPVTEEVERRLGQAQREEEPEAFIATDASARGHTASS